MQLYLRRDRGGKSVNRWNNIIFNTMNSPCTAFQKILKCGGKGQEDENCLFPEEARPTCEKMTCKGTWRLLFLVQEHISFQLSD